MGKDANPLQQQLNKDAALEQLQRESKEQAGEHEHSSTSYG